jgi:hypothetical protein
LDSKAKAISISNKGHIKDTADKSPNTIKPWGRDSNSSPQKTTHDHMESKKSREINK